MGVAWSGWARRLVRCTGGRRGGRRLGMAAVAAVAAIALAAAAVVAESWSWPLISDAVLIRYADLMIADGVCSVPAAGGCEPAGQLRGGLGSGCTRWAGRRWRGGCLTSCWTPALWGCWWGASRRGRWVVAGLLYRRAVSAAACFRRGGATGPARPGDGGAAAGGRGGAAAGCGAGLVAQRLPASPPGSLAGLCRVWVVLRGCGDDQAAGARLSA